MQTRALRSVRAASLASVSTRRISRALLGSSIGDHRRGPASLSASITSQTPRSSSSISSASLASLNSAKPASIKITQKAVASFATMAQTTSNGSSSADPSNVSANNDNALFAPSLAHLDARRLPYGYEKPSQSDNYATFLPSIEQSANDDRMYRLIRLDNGIECMLVSDPKTDKAAAGISVRAGHLSDPENAQGMAHFCEHLLFMGTEKYPAENDYNEYLSQNNGMSNAFTGMDETVYFFDVHPPALPGALDRFAQFFIAPLFTDSCTEREILAVDSENKKNLQVDMWRLFQLEKSTSSKSHHYWRFGTGNKQTLWDTPLSEGRGIRNELIQWYNEHYSANLMKLVVIGKDSLDDLAKLASKTFAPVKNKDLPAQDYTGSPFTSAELQHHVFAQTVRNMRTLELLFPIADQDPMFASRPGHFITHFLGHEGEGSILSHLRKLGWADSLSAGAGSGASGFDFFKISLQLTAAGLAKHEEVVKIVFQYIELLRSTPPLEWAFKEQSMLNEIGFRFVEKGKPSSYVVQLATQMQKPFPRQWLLSAPWLLKDWQPKLVEEQLKSLTPENCRITVASQEPVNGLEWDQKEQWYGTRYRQQPFDSQTFVPQPEVSKPDGLHLPSPNSFIPSNLDILGTKPSGNAGPSRRPELLRQTPTSRLWHKQDDRWFVPRAGVALYIKSPIIDASAENAVSTRMYLDLVMDAMAEYSYDADLAGLSYRLDSQADGIIIQVDGYNDKLPVLARVVLEKMANIKLDPQRFDLIKDQNRRKYQNFNLAEPSSHTGYYMSYVTSNKVHSISDKLAALEPMTAQSLQDYIPKLLSKLHVESLVHGNLSKADAMGISDMIQDIFKNGALSKDEKISPLSLLLPPSSNLVLRLPVTNAENVNSAIEYFCYTGDDGDAAIRTRNMLFCQLINEPCFDTLRTKEQLGYLVHSSGRGSIGMTGFRISIQSEREASYLEDRIDNFLKAFEKYLEDLAPDQFHRERASLTNRLKEDYKNLFGEMTTYFMQIHSGYYDFERKTKDAELISQITKEDILAYFRSYISPDSPTRAKLSVQMQSQHVSKATLQAIPAILETAGVGVSEEMKAAVSVSPTPLISSVLSMVEHRLSGQEGIDIPDILDQIKELHSSTQSNNNKKVFTDIGEVRQLMTVGPPSFPTDEYKHVISN